MRQSSNLLFQRATQAHSSGNLQVAEKTYRQILESDPLHSDALHYLGVIALQSGQPVQAISLIEKSLKLAPENADALSNLGNALQASGNFEGAVTAIRAALTINPENHLLRANLGNALCQSGEFQSAIDEYQLTLKASPGLVEVERNLASAMAALGQYQPAILLLDKACLSHPNNLELALTRANILQASGDLQSALKHYQNLVQKHPSDPGLHNNFAILLREVGQLARALEHHQKAVDLAPQYAEGHFNLGAALNESGDAEGSATALREAIKLAPGYGKAHSLLSRIIKHESVDSDMQLMQQLIVHPQAPSELKMNLGFGLGKAYEDLADYDKAFANYRTANENGRSNYQYQVEDDCRSMDNLIRVFDRQFIAERSNNANQSQQPIFIVGMPRSGTSLVEQIIASHPQVHGAGELKSMAFAIAKQFQMNNGFDYSLDAENCEKNLLEHIAEDYLASIDLLAPGLERITDKLPMNYLHMGLIKTVLPQARVIHCRRNPVDTCVSIYKNDFSQDGHFYAQDQLELAEFYNQYLKMMRHWREIYGDSLIEVKYEELVNNQEAESIKLIESCGLDWHSDCLNFHQNQRQVTTLSASQVRQPIYQSSVGKWKSYQAHLEQLLSKLEYADY